MSRSPALFRIVVLLIAVPAVMGVTALSMVLESKQRIFQQSLDRNPETEPFPVGVNVQTRSIIEHPHIEHYYDRQLAGSDAASDRWWNQVAAVFASSPWYQNLASPVSRIVVIWPGERKEQVISNLGDILGWDESERASFQEHIERYPPNLIDGTYHPGQYTTHRHASPEEVAALIHESFTTQVLQRYTPEVAEQVPLEDALIIASLLEREASDFNNMREVSGVIWNRLFIDMPLQLDATLQYVRGSRPSEQRWWPAVKPADKFLSSPYNTYEHDGLPPGPIANVSPEAILAALNPAITDCLYYFHTAQGGYHCSESYEQHVQKLQALYGRGS